MALTCIVFCLFSALHMFGFIVNFGKKGLPFEDVVIYGNTYCSPRVPLVARVASSILE